MSDVPTLIPAPQLSGKIERGLHTLTEQRMLAPARQAGYELHLVGATVLPQRQVIARTAYGAWLFVDHWKDPTADEDGDHSVPPDQLNRLLELDRLVAPDHLFVGHQLPDSYREGDPVPQLVPKPRHLREKDERLTHGLRTASIWLAKSAKVAASASVAAIGAVASLGAGLDPIIFGGVQHPDYPVVEWVVLAHWVWE